MADEQSPSLAGELSCEWGFAHQTAVICFIKPFGSQPMRGGEILVVIVGSYHSKCFMLRTFHLTCRISTGAVVNVTSGAANILLHDRSDWETGGGCSGHSPALLANIVG